jgi:hypothetical protein
MSRNGTYIATGSTDGTVYLLDWTGSILWSHWNGGISPGKIHIAEIASDGSAVVSASDEHEVAYFSTGVLDVPAPAVNASAPAGNATVAGNTPAGNTTGNTTTPGTTPVTSPPPTNVPAGVVLPLLGLVAAMLIASWNRRK